MGKLSGNGPLFCAVCLICYAVPLRGQALHVSSVSARPGEKFTLEISIDLPAGLKVATLKWTLLFPAQLVDPEQGRPEAREAAKSAGKSLTCVQPKPYAYSCILTGGLTTLTTGRIAVFPLRVRADAHTGTTNLRITDVDAADTDLRTVKFGTTDGSLTIR